MLAAGGSYPAITVNYTVPAGTTAGTLTNTATVTGGGDPTAPHTASAAVTIPPPTLSITKLPATNTVVQSGTGSFTLTVSNAAGGGYTTAAVTVTDPVPAGLTVTGTPSGTGWNCAATVGQAVSCTRNDFLAPGTSYPAITVNYTVPAGTVASTLTNTATVTGGGDPTSPHSASATVTIPPPALSITKLPLTNTVIQLGTGSFTLTVSNAAGGGYTTAAVTVTDPVPAGLTVTGTPSGTGWNCGATAGQSVSCTRSDFLAPGANYPAITVNYTIPAGTLAGTLTNTATVTGGGDPTAPHSASATVTIPPPTLSITKLPLTNTVAENGTGSFTLTVSNAAGGGYTTAAVTVTDPVPVGLTVTGTPSGTGWNCGATAGQAVSCARSDFLAPGASYPAITVNYTASATAALGSPYTNTATVNGGGDPTAPHSASAQVIVPSPGVPAISITKLPLTNTVAPNGTGSFTLTISDAVNATTAPVTVTDPYPRV